VTDKIGVEIRRTTDPEGKPGVLVQFPDGWIVVPPREARRMAVALWEVAHRVAEEEKSEQRLQQDREERGTDM
jgi:hypothetical protein